MSRIKSSIKEARWELIPSTEKLELLQALSEYVEGTVAIELSVPIPGNEHGYIVHGRIVAKTEREPGKQYLFLSDIPQP